MLTQLEQQGVLVAAGFFLAVLLYFLVVRPIARHQEEKQVRQKKEQFIGLASHYLLTPITIIQTALSRLQEADTTLNTTQRMSLYEAIGLGQQRLWIIAEQLVLVSQIDTNDLKMKFDVGNFSDVVGNAISSVDIFARHKRVKITFSDNTKEVKEAKFDMRRIRQAIIALLDNAVKFSMEDTTIDVSLSVENGRFVLSISDQGIGMPQQVLNHLGERFYRGSDIYSFDYEGIGMGLNIAHAIIRLHEGNLAFTSREGRGTVATAQFPIL